MSEVQQAEVVVIGMGPGGEDVAEKLADAGVDVVAVERELVGGECPYWGCVPSKMMIRAADLLAEGRRIPGMAGESTVTPDWAPVARRIRDDATDTWNDQAAADRFTGKGGRLIRGTGRLSGPGRVSVDLKDDGGTIDIEVSRAVVIGTGSTAVVPPIPGLKDVDYWINRQAIETETVPASLTILGGGAIGLELAQVFARFGSRVTVVEAMDRLLALEEPESSALVHDVFVREGIDVRTGSAAEQVASTPKGITVRLANSAEITSERLLVATGRRADIHALGLAEIGIDPKQRWVPVDDHLRVAEGVWALGDVTGKGLFTHVSMYHAGIILDQLLDRPTHPAEYHAIPRVTFTDPEIGAVGHTEQQARDAGLRVGVAVTQIPSSARGWIHKAGNDGFIKLVEDTGDGVLVGATSAGPNGGEVLGLLALAVHARVPVERLATMIYAYPTFHRAIEAAVTDLRS